MAFKCPNCEYKTDCKPSFKRHIFRKRPCSQSESSLESIRKEIVPEKTNYICQFCNKGFNSHTGHLAHVAKAHVLSQRFEEKKHEPRDYGFENTEYIDDDFLRTMSYQTSTGIPEIVRRIHFHPDHPENHNVRVVSKRDRVIERLRDGKWVKSPHYEVVNMMFYGALRMLESFMADPEYIATHESLINTIVEEYNKLLVSKKLGTMTKNAIFVMIVDETTKIHGI
jgi:hypothetical protein